MPVLINEKSVGTPIKENINRKLIYLENILTAVIEISGGPMSEPDPPHSHPHEQISYIAEGELFLFIDGQKNYLKKGDLFAIPANVPHNIQPLSEFVKLVDSFTPMREDFL